jgi:peptide/nickel transport system permease protein
VTSVTPQTTGPQPDAKPVPAHRVAPPHVRRSRPRLLEIVIKAWGRPSGRASMIGLGILFAVAIFAPWIAPQDPAEQDLLGANQAPSWLGGTGGLLGTDGLGRDVLSRIIFGLRLSLVVGVSAATISAIIGLALGVLAGYYEKGLGTVLMRIADIQFAIPFTAVGIALTAVLGPGVVGLILILGIWGWTTYARTIVSTVEQTRRLDFVIAARTLGASAPRIMTKHISPSVLAPVIVLWSTSAGVLVLAESALSLLGLGVQPPFFSLGSMLADAQLNLRLAPWAAIAPGLVLMAIVLAFNTLGDALRDSFDPRATKVSFDPELS